MEKRLLCNCSRKKREHVRGAALQTPWSVEEREEVLQELEQIPPEPMVLTWWHQGAVATHLHTPGGPHSTAGECLRKAVVPVESPQRTGSARTRGLVRRALMEQVQSVRSPPPEEEEQQRQCLMY